MAALKQTLIIFDCDGVLVDSEVLAARIGVSLLQSYGFEMTVEFWLERYAGMNLKNFYAAFKQDHGREPPKDFSHRLRIEADAVLEQELRPIPGIAEALGLLQDRPYCVASNARLKRVNRSLTIAKLAPFFLRERRFSSEMVLEGKPAPDLFLHAAAKMGFSPSQCIVVEDSIVGVTAARAAGMAVMGFGGASHYRADHQTVLENLGIAHYFDDMRDLAMALKAAGFS